MPGAAPPSGRRCPARSSRFAHHLDSTLVAHWRALVLVKGAGGLAGAVGTNDGVGVAADLAENDTVQETPPGLIFENFATF